MTVSFTVADLKRSYIFIVLEQACVRERVRFMLNLSLLGHKMLLNFGLLFAFIGDVWQVLILDCAHRDTGCALLPVRYDLITLLARVHFLDSRESLLTFL